jgi:hypothetical protein
MEIIIHRINTIKELKNIPTHFGVEIDIRAQGSNIILNHDPFENGELFNDWLDSYKHGTLVLNIKEAGIETKVLSMVRERNLNSYFLLDVEFPFLYQASKNGEKKLAIRYSEEEPIQVVEAFKDKVDWVWIDTFTKLPLDPESVVKLKGFKTCLVCPERWNRSFDISNYINKMKNLEFKLDAVMTALPYSKYWE